MSADDGALVAVSRWDTAEHARYPRERMGNVIDRVLALGVQLEPPELYEVIVER